MKLICRLEAKSFCINGFEILILACVSVEMRCPCALMIDVDGTPIGQKMARQRLWGRGKVFVKRVKMPIFAICRNIGISE